MTTSKRPLKRCTRCVNGDKPAASVIPHLYTASRSAALSIRTMEACSYVVRIRDSMSGWSLLVFVSKWNEQGASGVEGGLRVRHSFRSEFFHGPGKPAEVHGHFRVSSMYCRLRCLHVCAVCSEHEGRRGGIVTIRGKFYPRYDLCQAPHVLSQSLYTLNTPVRTIPPLASAYNIVTLTRI